MPSTSALDTLIELATTASDEAAKRLGIAVRACDNTEKQLTMLLQYREEYIARFEASMAAGISIMGYRNFQLFLDKLDQAIEGQRKIVTDAQALAGSERDAWQASERKRMSYGTLATRAELAEQRKENKRDQKLMDEFATRAANYKR